MSDKVKVFGVSKTVDEWKEWAEKWDDRMRRYLWVLLVGGSFILAAFLIVYGIAMKNGGNLLCAFALVANALYILWRDVRDF